MRRFRRRPDFDQLETKRLLTTAVLDGSVLRVEGTSSADDILIQQKRNTIQVSGVEGRFDARIVRAILIQGNEGNDNIRLDRPAATSFNLSVIVDAGPGNDTIDAKRFRGGSEVSLVGGDGDDTILGGDGNDVINGGGGADVIDGGPGSDQISGGNEDDTLDGGSGNDDIQGENGDDVIYGRAGNDNLFGNADDDTIFGGSGNDVLSGGGEDDVLRGEGGNDLVSGDEGKDDLFGGDGDDTLQGGAGRNFLNGGPGRNRLIPGESTTGSQSEAASSAFESQIRTATKWPRGPAALRPRLRAAL